MAAANFDDKQITNYMARRMVSVLLKYERDYKATMGEQPRSHKVDGVVNLWND